ncbi:MAG: DUF2254 domain-containing protein [Burkholderiaceae bacterium]
MQLTSWSKSHLLFMLRRVRERLWARPLAVCVVSVAAVFLAGLADSLPASLKVPRIGQDALESLLTIQASSMLVIATFAVASMVSAYASASNAATPRAFALVLADDVSQNALSTFIGAFIFAIVALTASQNGYFGRTGLFTLFSLTLFVFAVVILTFVRWVDRIARLGRMGTTIDTVERATAQAMRQRKRAPFLGGVPPRSLQAQGEPVYAGRVGYVQHIDMAMLQDCTETSQAQVRVAALPGTFAAPGVALAYLHLPAGATDDVDRERLARAFIVGDQRQFEEDPRFGLVVLSEIAGRALSPAVNDPGTAIDVIGTLVRLFTQWATPTPDETLAAGASSRVEVPALEAQDMFDDAFTSLARDGAGTIEVAMRLQKAFQSLAFLNDPPMRAAATTHAQTALARARLALALPQDLANLESVAAPLTDSGHAE